MSTGLSRRLAALEEKFQPALGVPVFVVQMDNRGDTTQLPFVEYGGQRWTQLPNESRDDFVARATAGAKAIFKPDGRFPVLMLVVQHPRLSQEQWLSRFRNGEALPGVQKRSAEVGPNRNDGQTKSEQA